MGESAIVARELKKVERLKKIKGIGELVLVVRRLEEV